MEIKRSIGVVIKFNLYYKEAVQNSDFISFDWLAESIWMTRLELNNWGIDNPKDFGKIKTSMAAYLQDLASQGVIPQQQFLKTMKQDYWWSDKEDMSDKWIIIKEDDLLDDMWDWIRFKKWQNKKYG